MVKRVRVNAKAKSRSKRARLAAGPLALFGEPLLLEGEDADAYDELLARVRAEVNPIEVIEEMLILDMVALEWEVLRWRRLKTTLIRVHGLKALQGFLVPKLEYGLYSDCFEERLTNILQQNLPEDQMGEFAQKLGRDCAQNKPDAVDRVNKILDRIGLHLDDILENAQAKKAQDLVRDFVRRKRDAVTLVNDLLAKEGTSTDVLAINVLAENLEVIERIDRLTTIAENRRNAALREIDRRRAVLGETLRRTVQEVEAAEFKVIETTPDKGKNAA